MKRRKLISLLLGGILIVSVIIIYFCRDTSIIPLDVEYATSIRFSIYPEYDGNYTVTNNDRVKEIVRTINELDMQKETDHANRMSDNYYYFWIHISDKDVAVELDENTISLNREIYQADTSVLRTLLEQTYNDVMKGKID